MSMFFSPLQNSIANVSFMFWPDMKKCIFSYKMIALATPQVGREMRFFDMARSHLVCKFPAIICLRLEFYGKDIGMTKNKYINKH